jgi:hypothetical protein
MIYYKLIGHDGLPVSGSQNIGDIENRRVSLIEENELKADLERSSMASMLSYTEHNRRRAAIYGLFRERLSYLKSEINYWREAPVERVKI